MDSYYYPYSSANLEQFLPEVCVGPAITYIHWYLTTHSSGVNIFQYMIAEGENLLRWDLHEILLVNDM